MTKIRERYWIETDFFVHSSIPNNAHTFSGMKGSPYPCIHAPLTQNPHNPIYSRVKLFPRAQTFCGEFEPFNSLKNFNTFVT